MTNAEIEMITASLEFRAKHCEEVGAHVIAEELRQLKDKFHPNSAHSCNECNRFVAKTPITIEVSLSRAVNTLGTRLTS